MLVSRTNARSNTRSAAKKPSSGRRNSNVRSPQPALNAKQAAFVSSADRRAARREEKRQAMVESASRLFADLGYAECEMDRVAARMRVAKGTLYLYFPGKQDLFFACVDWGMKQMQAAVRMAADPVADPLEKIVHAIRAYLEFFAKHPQYVELLIQERAIFRDRKRPTYFEHRDSARVYWREVYQDLVAQGRLRGDLRVESMLDAVGNLVYGTMFTNHFLGQTGALGEQAAGLLDVVFRGILSGSERKRGDTAR